MRHVIFVNRYFHPDHSATSQLVSDLAFHLAARGWRVEAITSRQLYDDPRAAVRSGTVEDVRIFRLPGTSFGRSRLRGRLLDYVTFMAGAFFSLLRRAGRNTIIVALTDPPLISVVAAAAARLRGARLVNWIHDIFPEIADALGVTRRSHFTRRIRDWSVRSARANVVLASEMTRRITSDVVVRHNWPPIEIVPVDARQNALRTEWGLEGRFVVGYSGNLGRVHDQEALVEAARRLPAIHFLIIGSGAGFDSAAARLRDLPNVQTKPLQPIARLSESLSAADVHLVTLRPEAEGLVVPSKIYGVLAAGRPAIYIGSRNSEIPQLIESRECGAVVDAGDHAALAQLLELLSRDSARVAEMGKRARSLYEERFQRSAALADWERILERVDEE